MLSRSESHPLISIVIPTLNRPELLMKRAIPSALAQVYPNFEVVVVVDGPDDRSAQALEGLDGRIRVVQHPEQRGVSAARNTGVAESRGEYVAFLDDDDEWRPGKISAQHEYARNSTAVLPVVFGGWIGRTPQGDRLHPPRLLEPKERLGDYMFVRRSLRDEENVLLNSTVFVPKALAVQVPFDETLNSQEDWDWMLRAEATPGVGFSHLPKERADTLTIYYFGENRPSGSRHNVWDIYFQWAVRQRQAGRISERAFAGLILFQIAPRAAAAEDPRGLMVLSKALLSTKPRLSELLRFAKHMVPISWRRALRARINARRPVVRL